MNNIFAGAGGLARRVAGAYAGVDGTARRITGGYVGVDGIARRFLGGGQEAGALAIGDTIALGALEGRPIVWYVADKNPSAYTAAEDGVVLIARNVLRKFPFDAPEPRSSFAYHSSNGNGDYGLSNLRQWLNSDAAAGEWFSAQHSVDAPPDEAYTALPGFLTGFSQSEKDAMLETRINYHYYNGSGASALGSVSGKVFLPSLEEIGIDSFFAPLALFSDGSHIASTLEDGTGCNYWLNQGESPMSVYCASASGQKTMHQCYFATGVRPAINLRARTLVTAQTNAGGHYELV